MRDFSSSFFDTFSLSFSPLLFVRGCQAHLPSLCPRSHSPFITPLSIKILLGLGSLRDHVGPFGTHCGAFCAWNEHSRDWSGRGTNLFQRRIRTERIDTRARFSFVFPPFVLMFRCCMRTTMKCLMPPYVSAVVLQLLQS